MMMHLADEMIEEVAVIISAARIGGEKVIEQLPSSRLFHVLPSSQELT
jgi:hypothetical protein